MTDPLPQPETPKAETGIRPGFPAEPPPTPREEIAYQPISGWAVGGFAAGALFALMVIVATAVALSQGAPMFFPIWVIGLAVLGIVLSLLGQWHVQSSEGTRAGGKLARIGLWLSIISGLSYLSYFYVTGLALENQANAFLMEKTDDDSGFFPRLREGATDPVQLNAAFLLTRPRRSAKPENEKEMIDTYDLPGKDGTPGELSQFKYGLNPGFSGTLSRIFFANSAKDAEVIPLAVQEWKYEQKSYQVRRNYRIKTKEIDWEVSIIVISTEAEAAGQGRKWFVNLAQSYAPNEAKQLTKFGAGMSWLRLHAKAELSKWIARLNGGAALPSVKDRDKTDWDKRFGDDYLAKRDLIYKLFEDNTAGRFQQFNILGQAGEVGNWAEKGDKYRVYIPFRFPLHKTPGPQPSYFVDAYAVFETVKGGINLEQVDPMAPPDVEMLNFVVTGITPAVVPPQGKGGPMTP